MSDLSLDIECVFENKTTRYYYYYDDIGIGYLINCINDYQCIVFIILGYCDGLGDDAGSIQGRPNSMSDGCSFLFIIIIIIIIVFAY
eukprot:CAMPEP_0170788042 /NCGR_PEP_ID=MMETSP0733-20121128/18679_1 /TAXON_ID=186038 /ORGANISM="Fragilariopsis kerguelensis, Strain L26-C5" /LENGTH=86 /DNA_ID=CAMNT_0011134437 /DNA_START=82 /DNA_END=345 /DNA_ORIENTATION=-